MTLQYQSSKLVVLTDERDPSRCVHVREVIDWLVDMCIFERMTGWRRPIFVIVI